MSDLEPAICEFLKLVEKHPTFLPQTLLPTSNPSTQVS